ncbi:uncharacterized protein V6R79_015329 [Siganus canaliculatus]
MTTATERSRKVQQHGPRVLLLEPLVHESPSPRVVGSLGPGSSQSIGQSSVFASCEWSRGVWASSKKCSRLVAV